MRTLVVLLSLLLSLTFSSCVSKQAASLSYEAEKALAQEQYRQAAHLFDQASVLQPSNASYRYNSLWAQYYAGEYNAVISQSAEAYERFADHLEFLLLKAKALAALEAYVDAYAVYEEIFAKETEPEALMQAVMDEAYRLGYTETAASLAIVLLEHRKYEEAALTLLAELYPEAWYQRALEYLSHRP